MLLDAAATAAGALPSTVRPCRDSLTFVGACQFFCVWGLEVGGDSVGVGGGELEAIA